MWSGRNGLTGSGSDADTLTMEGTVQGGEKVLAIQSYSYEERQELLPELAMALQRCGGWVLDRRVISGTTLELTVEVAMSAAVDLYGAMVQAGLELTRTGHAALTELCQRCKYMRALAGLSQMVTLRLEVSFPGELPVDTMAAHVPTA